MIVWDLQTSQPQCRIQTFGVTALGVTFDSSGERVVGAMRDGTLRIGDSHSGEELHRLVDQTDISWSVALSPDGRFLLTGGGGNGGGMSWGRDAGSDYTLRLWKMPSQ